MHSCAGAAAGTPATLQVPTRTHGGAHLRRLDLVVVLLPRRAVGVVPARAARAERGEAGRAARDAGARGELVPPGQDDGVLGAVAQVFLVPARLEMGARVKMRQEGRGTEECS